jgi:GxxExxY protein
MKRDGTLILHGDISEAILGAFFAVHSELGCGFLETVYANALGVLLREAGFRVQRESPFEIHFHGEMVGHYRADLVVQSRIVVEVKSAQSIVPQHVAQLVNYLKASRLPVGLLLNFGEKPGFRRVVWTRNHPRQSAVSASIRVPAVFSAQPGSGSQSEQGGSD